MVDDLGDMTAQVDSGTAPLRTGLLLHGDKTGAMAAAPAEAWV